MRRPRAPLDDLSPGWPRDHAAQGRAGRRWRRAPRTSTSTCPLSDQSRRRRPPADVSPDTPAFTTSCGRPASRTRAGRLRGMPRPVQRRAPRSGCRRGTRSGAVASRGAGAAVSAGDDVADRSAGGSGSAREHPAPSAAMAQSTAKTNDGGEFPRATPAPLSERSEAHIMQSAVLHVRFHYPIGSSYDAAGAPQGTLELAHALGD